MGNRAPKVVPLYFSDGSAAYNDTCVICLSHIDAPATVLPCGHAFHCDCILDQLEHKMTCPLCMKDYEWVVVSNR